MFFAIISYAIAMTLANLSVAAFGPAASPINAFFLIGFDLAMRDWLHVRLKQTHMLFLIVGTGVFTYVLNPAAGMIAIASASAFTLAALIDFVVFSKVSGSWLKRSNTSNVAAAAVDSIVFPTIAFGALMPHIVLMQFVAKVAGGAIWAWVISRLTRNAP